MVYVILNENGTYYITLIRPVRLEEKQRVYQAYPNASLDELVWWRGQNHVENHRFEEITEDIKKYSELKRVGYQSSDSAYAH